MSLSLRISSTITSAPRGRTVTEADIVNFAGLSGDFVELHMSEIYAAQGRSENASPMVR